MKQVGMTAIDSIYFNGNYATKNPNFHIEDSPWKAKQILQLFDRNNIEPRTVCEVGCGAGEILKQLQEQIGEQINFFGYEISPQAFQLCKQREGKNLAFYNLDITKVETPRFDTLLCIDVFEHIEDYFTFLRDIQQKANLFIFHIPLDMNVQMIFRAKPILYVREKVGHIHYFSKDTALATLDDAGFQILDYFYTPNGVDHPKSRMARIGRWPRILCSSLNLELTARIFGGYSLMGLARPQPLQTRNEIQFNF